MNAPNSPVLDEVHAPRFRVRETTVLVAGLETTEGSLELERAPVAVRPATQCLAVLGQAVALSGGRIVKSGKDEVMAVFNSPDSAAIAAARMQTYVDAIAWARPRFSVRIGFHSGPVGQRDGDIFGDTVNLALQLLDEAKEDQILTSEDTASRLGAMARGLVRSLPDGRPETGPRSELVWRDHKRLFGTSTGTISLQHAAARLQLSYRGTVVLRRRQYDAITIGRDPECGLGVSSRAASRRHCTIQRHYDSFILRDHSTNGTFLTTEAEVEQRIHGGEIALSRRGWIAFGESRNQTEEVVQYQCSDGAG